ncbi:elongator complex protein 4 [Cryptococcus deuterogattii 2001/935-1]|nr:elongator complex protein 4 [Cryptococcus deuterogattii 2001/935-1]
MDDLLGGGLPLHSILLVLAPDTQSAWGRLVERYWIAQGLVSGQAGLLVGEKEEGESVVKGCMWTEGGAAGDGSESEGEGGVEGGERRIAWRYEKMGKFQTTVKGNGSNLSLMTTIPPEALSLMQESGQMSYVAINSDEPSTSQSTVLDGALQGVWEKLQHADKGRATRLAVHELGSLDWGNISMAEIHRFIHSLRELLKSKPASVLITLPASLILSMGSERESIVRRLAWGVDACVELKGFADDPTLPPLFPTHGLLTLHSYPITHSLLPSTLKHSTLLGVSQSSTSISSSGGGGGAGENNLGFRLKRKRFVVETVHLGVEGGVGERRTGGDVREALDGADATHSHKHSHPTLTGPSSGVDLSQSSLASTPGTGVDDRPRGADQDKKSSKPRARVRFGAEEEVIIVGKGEDGLKHDHAHSHTHDHGPRGKDQAPKIALRHDRPDLYEF